jgi:hypothetical protein
MGLSKERQTMQCCLVILLSEITRHVTLNENFASNYAHVGSSLIFKIFKMPVMGVVIGLSFSKPR